MSALWLSTNPSASDAALLLSININSETHGLTRYEVGDSADFYLALAPPAIPTGTRLPELPLWRTFPKLGYWYGVPS